MAKRSRTLPDRPRAPAAASAPAKEVIHSSLYLASPVYEALRKIAFEERLKIHDLVVEGIDAVLRRRGYPTVENLKQSKKPARQ